MARIDVIASALDGAQREADNLQCDRQVVSGPLDGPCSTHSARIISQLYNVIDVFEYLLVDLRVLVSEMECELGCRGKTSLGEPSTAEPDPERFSAAPDPRLMNELPASVRAGISLLPRKR